MEKELDIPCETKQKLIKSELKQFKPFFEKVLET